jgi:hypothetical protein
MSVPAHPSFASLTSWLEEPTSNRALIIEDGSMGSISPLARWIEDVRAEGSHEVISASMGPNAGLVLERDILIKLHNDLYPDDSDEPGTVSLGNLRHYVREGLRARESQSTRLVALDRVNWGEQCFHQNLGDLLSALEHDQKIVVSIRVDDEREPNLAEWCERLGWRAEETLCLRLSASLDGELPPRERAREWVNACLEHEAAGGGHTADVLDVLAYARRPLYPDELATILDLPRSVVDVSLRCAPQEALAEVRGERFAFHDPTSARAWVELRSEASARVRDRVLALGEAALRGEARLVVPYVIEHYGSLLFERGASQTQVSLVSRAWANAWSSLGNLLGFEADVARVWFAAERELLANASAPAQERAALIFTIFRCVQVSTSVMSRVPGLPDSPESLPRQPKSGNTVDQRVPALLGLAEELMEPQKTRIREYAVDELLAAELKVTQADLLVSLAKWFEGDRRAAIVAKVLETYRADGADSSNNIWLLRAAPLLPAADREALCNEVIAGLHALPDYEMATFREKLAAMPPDVALRLTAAIPALPEPDRFRLECALAPYLEGDVQRRIIEEILDVVDANPYSLNTGDARPLAQVLDAAQLSRLGRALQRADYREDLVGICMRALCALGRATDAELLAGPDLRSMPFDWVLALAVSLSDRRPELREELARRLSSMDGTTLGWIIDRNTAELAAVLGADPLIRFVRAIPDGEQRIVARIALVPFAVETEKRALITEAIQAFRAPTGQEELYGRALVSCWEWMSIPDACYLLARVSYDSDALWALKDFAPLLRHLAGPDGPSKMAEQLVEVGRWAP